MLKGSKFKNLSKHCYVTNRISWCDADWSQNMFKKTQISSIVCRKGCKSCSWWQDKSYNNRVLSPQFELIDSQCLGIFQLLYILHLFIVASELLRDQDLDAPADNRVRAKPTCEKRSSKIYQMFAFVHNAKRNPRLWLIQQVNPNKTATRQKRGVGVQHDSQCGLWHIL